MAQSLAKIYVHVAFSTKNRGRVLPEALSPALHNYKGGILRDLGCKAVEINTEPDHAHVLFVLARTKNISEVVGELKRGSGVWLQNQHVSLEGFHWQNGYGDFSVSQSGVNEVRDYIRDQREHHLKLSFQDELRIMLRKYEIEFDEHYVWD